MSAAALHSPESVARALHDRERLLEIDDLALTSPEVDAILQEVATDAAAHFGLPIGLVTVVLDEAQYFAATHGVTGWAEEARGTPVEWSFCRFTVSSREAFVIEDATQHDLAAGNPLVEQDGVRCYAGIPMISSRGHALGSVCVLGAAPRAFSEADLADLRAFAAAAVRRIEARRGGG